MTKRLKKFFNIHKYFLSDVDSMEDLVMECKRNQEHLGELIQIKSVIARELKQSEMEYERKVQLCRNNVQENLKKRGSSYSEVIVRAKVEHVFGEEIQPLKEKYLLLKVEYETTQDLYYAMMQRKDILTHIMMVWKNKEELQSCLLNNREVIEVLKKNL